MKRGDAAGGKLKRGAILGWQRRERGGKFLGADAQALRRQLHAVEAMRQANQRAVALAANRGNNFRDGVVDRNGAGVAAI